MVTIIDYKLGNIGAIKNIYNRLNIPVTVASNPDELLDAKKLILPGVGAFDRAMTCLDDSGFREYLDKLVLVEKVPVLGICVGMQMMAKKSTEGTKSGLGWIDANVKKFDKKIMNSLQGKCLPHMGWNVVQSCPEVGGEIFSNIASNARFYFLHSYYFSPNHEEDICATTYYGESFVSAVQKDNIFGVQFHPEKSHQAGIQLLKNFSEL
ncbi:MAG: imidazole glycerol phosphate synthase subunit HisH [Legionellaceae bacterium]|nr:imidazole glycerol phosphate synthase subunit HisH [Legionellaceae bacterium]